MKPPLCPLTVSFAATVIGIVCYFGYLELERFTGGKFKKLEELDKQLADKLDEWHPLPERLYTSARFTIFLCPMVAVIAFVTAMKDIGEKSPKTIFIVAPLLVVVGFLLAENIAARTSIVANAKILCFFIPVFNIFSYFIFPLVWLLEMPLKSRETQGETQDVNTAEDEILSLIDKKEEGEKTDYVDDIEEDERRIVTGAFELDDTTVHEIMTPRVDIDAISEDSSVEDTVKLILESGHSRIPVYKQSIDQIIGVIYAKDLLDKNKVYAAKSLTDLVHPSSHSKIFWKSSSAKSRTNTTSRKSMNRNGLPTPTVGTHWTHEH